MKKLFVCLLALLMLVPLLVACNSDKDVSSESSETSEFVITTPVKDLEGREIYVLCWDFGATAASIMGYTGEIIYDEENPTSVDVAKKLVVDNIESTYNCKIVGEMISTGSIPNTIRNQVTSGIHYYDIVFDSISSSAPLAADHMLTDLTTVSTIDLEDAWWDQNAVKDFSIGSRVYFACGDINNYDDQGTWCMLFNKTLKEKLAIEEDFYQLARDKEWTFDKFVEICKNGITTNSNGDDVLDEKDTWAFGTELYNIYVHLVGAGETIARKDDDDLPYLTVLSEPEATYSVLTKVLEFYNDGETVMIANASPYKDKGFNNMWEETVHKAFIEGRELFYMCGLINVASFRQMEDEFGILPIPMFYENQDSYHHTVSRGNSTVMYIPRNATNVEDLGLAITAIAEQSKHFVTPAYYDVQLKYRDSRDDESGEMLDIIFASRSFDIGMVYNWGGILECFYDLNPGTVTSRFEAISGSAQTAMNNIILAFEEDDK